MATAVLQNALVWMLWLVALASCGGAKGSPRPSIERVLYYGHLTIGTKKLNLLAEVNPTANKTELFRESFGENFDYQSDPDPNLYGVTEEVFSHKRISAVDRLLGMKPKVECVENSMMLKLRGAAPLGSPFLIDRGNAHPLSLAKVLPDCGYTVRKSWRDLTFSTPYDGCFVTQEDSIYILHLVIYGIPVRMACPSTPPKPPSVSCHEDGMTVKVESSTSVKDVQVKVNRKWESLMKVSAQCGFSVTEHPEGVIISATYLPCIKEKDGMLTFEVAAKGDFKISCPAQPSTVHARATACPESSRTECSTTSLAVPPKETQIPIQTGAPGHSVTPQHPQTPVPQATQAPHTDRPGQPPAQFPLYYFKYEFNQPSPEPDNSEVQAPPGPVYHKKPLVEDPSKNMPLHIPKPAQFPAQFPFYFFKPEFHHPDPKLKLKPGHISPSPDLDHSTVPHDPLTPVFQTTQAPPGPVYPKKPAIVEDPSKNRLSHIPKPAQFPAQFPFYVFTPEFYKSGPKPDGVLPSPKPERSQVPQHPQMTPSPVVLKKTEPVEDPSKSMPFHTPEPIQFQAHFPYYLFKPEFYWSDPKPDRGSPSPPKKKCTEEPQLPQRPVPQTTHAPLGPASPVEDHSKSLLLPQLFPIYFFNNTIYLPQSKPDGDPANTEPEPSKVPKIPQMAVPQVLQVTPKQPVTHPPLTSPKHCLTACSVAHSNCCPLALSLHQHVHHHNHFAPAFGQAVQPAPATSDKEPSFIQLLINHSLIRNGNKQVPHTFLGTLQNQTTSTTSVQTDSYQEHEAKPVHLPESDPAVKPISSPAHRINLPFLSSYMHIPKNGHWFPIPAVTPSSVQLTQLPASKLHSNRLVKEPPPYLEFQYPYGLPNPKYAYSSGPDNPANSPKTMSISTAETLGLHRDPVAKAHQSTVKYSLTHPLLQIPYFGPYPPPTTEPDSQTKTETYPHLSVTSSIMLTPESTKKSVPHQWGWHPFLNPFLKPNMEGEKWNIPDVSSDSPQVPSILSKYSTLKHPVPSSGPAPQKQHWHQAVTAKAAAHNRFPKAPFKSDASNPYPQNSFLISENSISSPRGESFAPLGSPQSFKDYWKKVRPPHS